MKVLDPSVQTQEFLSAFPSPESLLNPLLSPCGTVGLFDDIVAPGRGDDVLVVNVDQVRYILNGDCVTPELVNMDDL